jgi:uncharacterized protein YdeI (YjbR/CyaY-like superfamily)
MPKRGSELKPLFFKSPDEYRKWLERNHDSATELWIGFWKKATGKPSLTWQQCVDESLCFGWIDGIRKSIDAESFKQRVTPRRTTSIWSQINIRRIGELTAEGRMHPNGTAAFEKRNRTRVYSFENPEHRKLGPDEEARFRKNKKAWSFFESLPPGFRRNISWWVMSAKQEATRLRRLETLIRDSAAGRRTGDGRPETGDSR